MKKKLVTGVKPTGRVHLGNYFGVLERLKGFQEEYDSRIFIADLHALTSVSDRKELEENIFELMTMYLAIGLDPKKTILYRQSDVPQVSELSWIFSSLATMPYLMRAHSFKDAEAKNKEINVATFSYPLLMAADILLSDADVVPVGKDQKQHVEITRDMARKFNTTFGDTFKEPAESINEETETVIGTDGQKMSKSYNNVIPLFASSEEIKKIVMGIPTDSKGIDEPKDPDNNLLFHVHSIILNAEQKSELRKKYETPGLGYKTAKEDLIKDLENFIAPLREAKEKWESKRAEVIKIYKEGGEKMREIAEKKMKEAREKIGLTV
jgi:tryptophanyl-tRNA synthetase